VSSKRPLQFIIAEYCRSFFYGGWHLYERDHNDGRRNKDGDWGWLRGGGWQKERVQELVVSMGHELPEGLIDFPEWFAMTFPCGLRVTRAHDSFDEMYELHEIVTELPKQFRCAIRTLGEAAEARRIRERSERVAKAVEEYEDRQRRQAERSPQ